MTSNAYNQGYEAYNEGLKATSNPYISGMEEYSDWLQGWSDSQVDEFGHKELPID